MKQRGILGCCTAMAAMCLATVAIAGTPVEAGWILDYSVTGSPRVLSRAHSKAPVVIRMGTALYLGDRLDVPSAGRVRVGLADGDEHEVIGPARWTVPDAAAPGVVRGLVRGFFALLEKEDVLAASAVARAVPTCVHAKPGSPAVLRVPILEGTPQVAAGRQPLMIEWQNGCPPFKASLRSGDAVVSPGGGVTGQRVEWAAVELRPGRYEFEVLDAMGNVATAGLEVRSAGPPPPPAIEAAKTTVDRLALALWFAQQDNGAWRLESLKTLRPLVEGGVPIAARLEEALLRNQSLGGTVP